MRSISPFTHASPASILLLLALLGSLAQASTIPRAATTIRPYTIDVDPSFIESTRLKASTFRPSIDIAQPAWTDGPPVSTIVSLADYWVNTYNWSSIQSAINANFSHYMATLPSPVGTKTQDIHFIHQRSKRDDAIPLLMLHGWPSTSLEWKDVIPGLVDPADKTKPAFHVVAPDLPGYGFSPAPTAPGLGPSQHGQIFADLMEQLGYDRYALYSTDLGFVVALRMVVDYETHIINHITDFYFAIANSTDIARLAANQTTAEESAYILAQNSFFTNYSAYSAIHSTFPLSIAHVLNDSPVGFLGWMYQLVYTVSDQAYTGSELITDALLLYIPGVYGNIRSYKELFSPSNFAPTRKNGVPTSVLQFGNITSYPGFLSVTFAPRDWVERSSNVTYFSRHDTGGHFPALSQPELVLADIRAIFA